MQVKPGNLGLCVQMSPFVRDVLKEQAKREGKKFSHFVADLLARTAIYIEAQVWQKSVAASLEPPATEKLESRTGD